MSRFTASGSALSSTSESPETTIPLPATIAVQPGTSPVETQGKVNPINSSCIVSVVGATRGIGLEFVKQCLQNGATVIATHRSDDVPSTIQAFESDYPENQIHFLQIDLTSESSIQNVASAYQSMKLGPLTCIIHIAGMYLPGTSFDGTARKKY